MKKGKFGQRSGYIIIILLFLVAVNVTLGFFLTRQSNKALVSQIQGRMLDLANTAADMLDGDELKQLKAEDKDTEEYRKAIRTLSCFRDNIELEYIYCIKDMGDKQFVFTIDVDEDNPGEFGSPVVYTDALYTASLGTPDVDDVPYEDAWGKFYSAYSPVYDSTGRVAGIVAVDFSADWYENQVAAQTRTVVIVCALSLLAGAAIVVIITEQSRRRSRQLYEQLNVLADNVGDLVREIGGETPDMDKTTDRDNKRKGSDIDDLGDKILSMQETLRSEIANVHRQAYIDALTSVGNKAAYLDAVKQFDEEIQNGAAKFSVAIFDINGLKDINDNYGHEIGDLALIDEANIMIRVFGKDNIYRLGGDEFIVLLPIDSVREMERLFREADKAIEEENKIPKPYKDPLALSKGYAVYDRKKDTAYREVFKRADDRMYQDKDAYYKRYPDKHRR